MYSHKSNLLIKSLVSFVALFILFYWFTYSSVSPLAPTSIPVHHDDYTNYAARFQNISLYVRPLSTLLITALSTLGPNTLIWSIRLLTVLYLLLCLTLFSRIYGKRYQWVYCACFTVITFSLPVVVEYARYTGMITHLISGCLGISAVILLQKAFAEDKAHLAWLSAGTLLLSVLAKEDFLILYGLSYCYFFRVVSTSKKVRVIGFTPLPVSALLILIFKTLTPTSFLGVIDSSSTYFINITPISIVQTVITYLSGANPALVSTHGNIVISVVLAIILLAFFVKNKLSHQSLYFLGCTISVILPYALLPNHINSYYEYLWAPFIVFSAYLALISVLNKTRVIKHSEMIVIILFSVASVFIYNLEMPARKSIATWYDARGMENSRILDKIKNVAAHASTADVVCVIGAGPFSPWFMHDGRYLEYVIDAHNKWRLYLPTTETSLNDGFALGATASKGRFSLLPEASLAMDQCKTLLDLRVAS